jgi:hypothetical protein
LLLLACRSGASSQPTVGGAEAEVADAAPEEAAVAAPPPPAPAVCEASVAAHQAALGRMLNAEPLAFPALHAPPRNPNEPPGFFVKIDHPPDRGALARFHAALRSGQRVRVAMYGASGTASDMAVGYVRTYLQSRFGNGGPGFVPLGPLSRWYRHSEVKVSASKAWMKEHAQIRKGRLDGHYGLLGASFYTTKKKQWVEIEPKASSAAAKVVEKIELLWLAQPGGGSFEVFVDGDKQGKVKTAAAELGPGYHALDVPRGAHRVRIQTVGDGEVRVFGAVFEAAEGGVVVDVLGIDGTRSENHLTWNEALWADNFARRDYDLVTLSYGTNESVDEEKDMAKYREDLRAVIGRMQRVLPEADILVLGPVDFPLRDEEGLLQERPQLDQIIAIQREVALELGAGFWDGIAFMGGLGSMQAWVECEPPLARRDYLHFTGRGAARKGQALCDALMLEYDSAVDAG